MPSDYKQGLYKEKSPPVLESFFIIRHRAIFPGLDLPSIVTAERLNCCVRYGNRCFPHAMDTEPATPHETNLRFFSLRGQNEIHFVRLLFSLLVGVVANRHPYNANY